MQALIGPLQELAEFEAIQKEQTERSWSDCRYPAV